MALTDTAVRNAKPEETPRKLHDAGGLYLLVTPAGGKYWRYDYRFDRGRKTLALGVYPEVSLKQARDRHGEARKQLASGIDPGATRKAERTARDTALTSTFKAVALEYVATREDWGPRTLETAMGRFEKHIFPVIGVRPIGEIDAPELLDMLKRIDAAAAVTAKKCCSLCSQVFTHAVHSRLVTHNPAAGLSKALTKTRAKHHAAIVDPDEVGGLLRALDSVKDSSVSAVVFYALRLTPLTFVRPGELQRAEWSEITLDGPEPEWRIPDEKMKMGKPHVVPLSRQAVDVLRAVQAITGTGRYVFPSQRGKGRHMSDGAVNAALARLGFKGEMTGHGFRTMASTLLNEHAKSPGCHWDADIIEYQLAHTPGNGVRAIYNRADYRLRRRAMMQWWADYLDRLKSGEGAKVIPLHSAS